MLMIEVPPILKLGYAIVSIVLANSADYASEQFGVVTVESMEAESKA
jgi:hypothetical protein